MGKVISLLTLVILSTLIILSALGSKIGGKMIKMIKVLNILMAGSLSTLPLSKARLRVGRTL
jgi:hypothetical protein